MSTSNASSRKANFTLCAVTTGFKEGSWDVQRITSLHGKLLVAFNADRSRTLDGHFVQALSWHYSYEKCYIQRPLIDLNDVSQDVLDKYNIHVHTYNQAELSPIADSRSGVTNVENGTDQGTLDHEISSDEYTSKNSQSKGGDASVGRVTLSAKFKSDDQKLLLAKQHWKDTNWFVNLDWSFEDIAAFLRKETAKRMRGNAIFDAFEREITYRPTIQLDGEQGRYAKFDIFGSTQIAQLMDLYEDSPEETKIPIIVRISSTEHECSGDAEEKFKDYFRIPAEQYHIGMLDAAACAALRISDTKVRLGETEKELKLKCAPTTHVVLGDLHDSLFQMFLIPVWYANGRCFGYSHFGTEVQKLPPSIELNTKYGLADATKPNVESFLRSIQDAPTGLTLLADDIKLPFYSFNRQTIDTNRRVPEHWPKQQMFLVGPFKTYLDQSTPVAGGFRIEITAETSLASIERSLDQGLSGTNIPRHDELIENGKRRFKYRLWILPQSDGGNKMVRYEGGNLRSYMDTERSREENELYMEAHLIRA